MKRLPWLRIMAHAIISVANAYDRAFAEELIADRAEFEKLGYDVQWLVDKAFPNGLPAPA